MRSALKSGQQARGAGQKTRGRPDALTRGEAPLLKQKKWEVEVGVTCIRQKGTNLLIL